MKFFVISLNFFTNIAVGYFQIGHGFFLPHLSLFIIRTFDTILFLSFLNSNDSPRLHFCPTATAVGPILQCPMRDD
jgi:hypothetical protein